MLSPLALFEKIILQGYGPHFLTRPDPAISKGSELRALRGIFSSVGDRYYRLILVFFTVYTTILLVVPIARLVPRIPVPLLTFILCYLLYKWKIIPKVLRPWLFYIVLTCAYWELQFVVNTFFQSCYGEGIIEFERSIFGVLPTVWLQQHLASGDGLAWYDYIFALFHSSLFFIPIVFPLLLLFKRGSDRMKRATVALSMITLAGYATYVLYPLSPPWIASLERMIPEVRRITVTALGRMIPGGVISAFSPSPRGAMPSLHAGVPILMLLMAFKEFGRRAWWVSILVLGICFEIVYGGEHYVVDVAAGLGYAVITYIVIYRWLLPDSKLPEPRSLTREAIPKGGANDNYRS